MRSHPRVDSVFDIAIGGAGIAGVSLACFAAGHATVLLLEREAQPAMHSTGRSAALFMESDGSPQVRALTRASRPFFTAPPAGFSALPLLSPRGALYIGSAEQTAALRLLHASLCADGCPAERLNTRQALSRVPVVRPEAPALAVLDPLAADLDGAWEVLAEPIQTVMRRHGLPQPYEQLKAFTRDKPMTRELMQGFIQGLALPADEKQRLLALTPAGYTGLAESLARQWSVWSGPP